MAGPGMGMGGPPSAYQHKRVEKPKNLADVPRYLGELLGGFFTRFFYIVKLVWATGWWVLLALSFVALFKGITPVIGSLISKNILNALQDVIKAGYLPESEFWSSGILYLLIALFAYRLLILVVNNISNAMNRIAGEKVVKEVPNNFNLRSDFNYLLNSGCEVSIDKDKIYLTMNPNSFFWVEA